MAKTSVSKAVQDYNNRMGVFNVLGVESLEGFKRVNNQGYGTVVEDGSCWAEVRVILHGNEYDADGNELSAEESLDFNAQEYAESVERKKREAEEKAREKEEKKKRDAELREKKKAAKKKEEEE